MRLRRYAPIVVISALLAVSGFAAAAIASSEGLATAAQTATTTLATTVVSTTTVTQTVTVTRRFPTVVLCHHRALNNGGSLHVTIRVSSPAVRAHRQHGDTLGSCRSAQNRRIHRARAHARKFH